MDKPLFPRRSVPQALCQCCKALLYLIAYFLIQFAVTAVVEFFISLDYLDRAASVEELMRLVTADFFQHYQVISILLDAVILLAFSLFFFCRRKNLAEETSLRPVSGHAVWLSPLLGIAGCTTVSVLLTILPLPASLADPYSEIIDRLVSGSLWLQLLAVVLLAPLTEEILFRGLVYSRLRRALPFWAAAVLSAAAFGLAHGNLVQSAYAFLLGVLLCLLRERSGSLLAPLLCHIAFNGTSYLLQLLPSPMPLRAMIALAAASMIVTLLLTVLTACGRIPLRRAPEPDDVYAGLPPEAADESCEVNPSNETNENEENHHDPV